MTNRIIINKNIHKKDTEYINKGSFIIESTESEFNNFDNYDNFNNFDIYDNYDKYNDMIEMMYSDKKNNKNDVKHNIFWCDTCHNDDTIEDTSHGNLVCRNCGQVISNLLDTNPDWHQAGDGDKKDTGRNSLTINNLLPQSSIATSIGGNCSSRIKILHNWGAMPYKERSLNNDFKIIQNKCTMGKILKCIENDAKIMYKNISDCNVITRGVKRRALIAACVLYACRKKDKTRSPKEIAELFDIKHTEITKGCKKFKKLAKLKHMEVKINFTKPEHFITRFCKELNIIKEYAEQAIQISNNIQKLRIASVHTPLSLATGSIYLMIQLNGFNIQKKTIADKFNVSQVTIAKAFKKLEPFINILTNNDICNQLNIEIIKYQENIEINDEIKPKFIRFGVNIDEQNTKKNPFSIYDSETNIINNKLIAEHDIEFIDKNYQIESEYMRLQLNFVDDIYIDLIKFNPNNFLKPKDS